MAGHILIAEDEPFIFESLAYLMTRAGYAVRAATDGDSALDQALSDPPALLILDVMMPGRNGFDVLAALRADLRGARTPVLVLTAKGQAADRERMTTLGADMFLTKPFSNKELIDSALALAGAAQ